MQYRVQYTEPQQFIMIGQLADIFKGGLNLSPESFGEDDKGFKTAVVHIPDANAAAFEKLMAQFELTEYYTKLDIV